MITRRRSTTVLAALATVALAVAGCSGSTSPGATGTSSPAGTTDAAVPSPSTHPSSTGAPSASATSAPSAAPDGQAARGVPGHVVIVLLENRSYSDIVGNRSAPFLNSLARQGANLTAMHAVTHPSQPNYVALFTGRRLGVTDDRCPLHLSGPSMASQLAGRHLTFAGFSQSLPRTGSTVCTAGAYARKHVPWADFAAIPASANRPFSAFPTDYSRLPTVSFVVPDLDHDMHDGTIGEADAWLKAHLAAYASWARTHGSLLVVTWDEDDRSEGNRIPTFVTGAGVRAHRVTTPTTTYSLLRLVEDRYGLSRLGHAATAPRIPLG